ncbi:HEPN domain-containing protein [Desulforamulus aeronauticus]|uniref:HEPN domain-containing protein n=1 Tax=Desulforamulus aeronauticus DSM 10349 TaxID=1121421 RepID=A0A1M6SF75_9FIRM|nr:HEPN domain-containing protein [Desulforamulus aeronauticus]SHK43335.1 HEPN domain-containing protein [Desulforamulus aeronauticus DSM 10349]
MGERLRPRTKNWLTTAEEDFEVAGQLLNSKKYLYSLFFCQQALEKILKAIYHEKFNTTPPRKHNLLPLAEDAKIFNELSDSVQELFDILSEFYLESRYSEDREALAQSCNKAFVESKYEQTELIFKWLKNKLISL